MSSITETSFLFWNVCRNETQRSHQSMERVLADMAKQLDLDVLMLAESKALDASSLLARLQQATDDHFSRVPIQCEKVQVFVRQSTRNPPHFSPKFDDDRFSCIQWISPDGHRNLLTVVHLPDKRNNSLDELKYRLHYWLDIIRKQESAVDGRSILVGDFNLNPFESPMTDAPLFNAVSSAKLAKRGSRTYQRISRPYFYNPMWNLLGDRAWPPGTYYRASPNAGEIHWNTLDQLLICPKLIDNFVGESLEVLTRSDQHSFTKKSHLPDEKAYSDHLPIYFRFAFPNQGAEP